MSLETDLKALAHTVREKAGLKDTPLIESIDALKALTGLYSALHKGKKSDNADGDDAGGFSFDTPWQPEEPPNGRAPEVRTRRGDS